MLVGLTWGFAGLGEGVASDDSASILMKIKYNIMFQNFTQLIIKRKNFGFECKVFIIDLEFILF